MDGSSAVNVVLAYLIFSVLFGFHFIEVEGRDISSLQRNVMTTIKTKYGQEYDCVDLYKQPALQHHLLKDHKIQMRPSFAVQNSNAAMDLNEPSMCPSGTVPIRRVTKEESTRAKSVFSEQFPSSTSNIETPESLIFAGVGTEPRPGTVYHGAGGLVSIWNPTVNPGQFSASVMSIEGGSPDEFSVIRVGWMVNPTMFHDNNTHLYTVWGQAENGVMHGCYNTYCPGFVQTDSSVPLDLVLTPISVLRGTQYYLQLEVSQDKTTGNWWLSYNQTERHVGYWPGNLFKNLNNGADALKWGGMVYSDSSEVPIMGNGDNGYLYSSHYRQLALMYEPGSSLNATIDTPTGVMKTKCYDAGDNYLKGEFWGYSLFFGGNGGDISKCKQLM